MGLIDKMDAFVLDIFSDIWVYSWIQFVMIFKKKSRQIGSFFYLHRAMPCAIVLNSFRVFIYRSKENN